MLKGIDQREYMEAIAGTDPSFWHVQAGIFTPGTPMGSSAGLDVFTAPREYDAARKEIEAAGYKGEKVILLAPTDFPLLKGLADVCADQLKKMGFNVDYQAMDWGRWCSVASRWMRRTRAAGESSTPSGRDSIRRTPSAMYFCAATARMH
jgi:ABC-type transport system substrate-binding protein